MNINSMVSGRRKILLAIVTNLTIFGLLFAAIQRFSASYEFEEEFELFSADESQWIDSNQSASLCLPYYDSLSQIVKHDYYMLSYNEKTEQANWVAYILQKEMTFGKLEVKGDFMRDAKVKTESADSYDYHLSGFDRGQLLAPANMKFDQKALNETFLMSNVCPQEPGFNRFTWKDLELHERAWARTNRKLYVVSGPIIIDSSFRFGRNAVVIPQGFFKVILDLEAPEYKGVGFIMPNSINSKRTLDFAVPIDSVEAITGIDFFSHLPDSIEQKLEADTFLNKWFDLKEHK
ncbi:MAG: DNA/RNA non-specific endonuclease [Bacteroidales bacterium]|nr:DNA/RNA non-specific endonuclease [Bacteroidales bacterium]